MPQIFIGGEHIGGCTDLFDALAQRRRCRSALDERRRELRPRRRSSIRTRCCRSGCSRARAPEVKSDDALKLTRHRHLAEAERLHVHKAIDAACREWGFFQVVGHGIDARLIGALRRQMRALFGAPLAEKARDRAHRGESLGFLRPGADAAHARLEAGLRLRPRRRRGHRAAVARGPAGVRAHRARVLRGLRCAVAASCCGSWRAISACRRSRSMRISGRRTPASCG